MNSPLNPFAPSPPVPLAWWTGDGTTLNLAGTSHNGATYAPGQAGPALSFEGVNDYVPSGMGLGDFDINNSTVEFWIKTTSTRLGDAILCRA